MLINGALRPNTLVNLAYTSRRRKPGRASSQHPARPGLRHLPAQAGYRVRLALFGVVTKGTHCIKIQA